MCVIQLWIEIEKKGPPLKRSKAKIIPFQAPSHSSLFSISIFGPLSSDAAAEALRKRVPGPSSSSEFETTNSSWPTRDGIVWRQRVREARF